MAQTVGTHGVAVFTSPSNGDTLDATVVKGNDNNLRSAYVDHDADGGLHVQSSSFATRSSPGSLGRKWLTTDTNSYRLFFDDGSAWYEVSYLSSNGGTVTGDVTVTGTLTASVTGSVTGNASTATALQTARTINGVSFNGTADITVTAAAGTLSGSTLNSGVTASSLTSVGTLSTLQVSGNAAFDTNTLFVDSVNNRVGVGTAAPGATLDVASGISRFGGSGGIHTGIAAGFLAGQAELYSQGTAPLGIGTTGTQPMRMYTGGTLQATLDATGNLGLGVVPSAWSPVIRAMQLGVYTTVASDTSGRALFGNNVYQDSASAFRYVTTTGATMYLQNFGEHRWYSAPSGTAGAAISFTQAMTLDASGRLGIGVTSPTIKLQVETDVNASDGLFVRNLNTGSSALGAVTAASAVGSFGMRAHSAAHATFPSRAVLQSDSTFTNGLAVVASGATPISFLTNGTERARIDSAGNLGLGVTPSAWSVPTLQLPTQFAVGQLGVSKNAYYDGAWKYITTGLASVYQQGVGTHAWFTAPSGTAGTAISFTQAMTLDASGQLSIGAAVGDGCKATLIGAAGFAGTGLSIFENSTGNSGRLRIYQSAGSAIYDATYATGNNQHIWHIASVERWRINSSGHLLAGADATYDIGASGATRPRDVYLSGNVVGGGWVRAGAASAGVAATTTIGSTTATTVGATGAAAALPANPLGYIIAHVGTTQVKIPYYTA